MPYLFCLIVLLIGLQFDKAKYSLGSKKKWYIFEWFCLVLLVGLRYKVGGDSLAYQRGFETNGMYPEFSQLLQFEFITAEYQPLWYIFVSLLKTICNSFTFLQVVHALFVNTVIFWFINKYACRPFLTVLFYYVMIYPYFNMEVLRESIAVCFFLLSYPYLLKNSYFKYILFAILAFGFHASALSLIFIPILMRLNTKNISLWNILIIVIIVLMVTYTPLIRDFISIVDITSIKSRAELYGNLTVNFNGMIFPFIRLFFLFMILYSRKIAKIYYREEDPALNSYLIIVGITIGMPFFIRIENYLIIPFYVFLLNSIVYLKKVKWKYSIACRLFIIGFSFILVSKTYYYTRDMSVYNIGDPARFYHRYIPYESVFIPEDNLRRERIYWNLM